jgi:hypothetical protein
MSTEPLLKLESLSPCRKISIFVSTYEEMRGVYMVLVGKPEGKRPLGRSTLRWEDNIKTILEEVG